MSSDTQIDFTKYIMNPLTKRSIVKNGRVYRRLLKDGIIKVEPKEEPKEEIKIKIEADTNDEELEEENKFEKLIENVSQETIEDSTIGEIIAKASEQVLHKYKDDLEKIQNEEDLFDEIKRLVAEELKFLL